MYILAQVVGIMAVTLYLLSYQQEKRRGIVLFSAVSSALYVLQYIMLGAFEGATLDLLATVSTVIAHNKDKKIVKKYTKLIVLIINCAFVVAGIALYKNLFSLCALFGAILQTSALWLTKEKIIRLVSFAGAPFWLIYNLASSAYGSATGSMLSIFSIGIAIYRYDILKEKIKHKGV